MFSTPVMTGGKTLFRVLEKSGKMLSYNTKGGSLDDRRYSVKSNIVLLMLKYLANLASSSLEKSCVLERLLTYVYKISSMVKVYTFWQASRNLSRSHVGWYNSFLITLI